MYKRQRYNLRRNRKQGWKDGDWRTSKREYGYHIAVKKALKKIGRPALMAIVSEIHQIVGKRVFHPVNMRQLTNKQLRSIIRSSIFLKEKYLPNGNFDKLKARLVAGGHMQDRSLYDDVSSPTVSTTEAFIVASIAASEGRAVATLDIDGAYLNADITEQEVLMKLDPIVAAILVKLRPDYESFMQPDGTIVVKLDKALYGCVESAKLWYQHLSGTLISMGFERNPLDICVFNRTDESGKQCTIVVHVDDLMITCKNEATIDKVIADLTERYKDVTVKRGSVHSYVGITFDFTAKGRVKLTMDGYVRDTLRLYEVQGKAATPAGENLYKIDTNSLTLDADRVTEFHSRVAKILYLAKRVRPDLLTATIFLATRVQSPTEDDWSKLNRLLKYLNATPGLGLVIEPDTVLNVSAYVDVAYGVHADGKSHTGSIITLGKGAVYVKSSKQKLVSKSSTEAELIALSDSSSQVIWTKNFIAAQGHSERPATVYQDNMSTIAMADKGRSTSERTKHIHVRYFFIKDAVERGEIKIVYKPTGEMVADLLTKPLQGEQFRRLRALLLNWH